MPFAQANGTTSRTYGGTGLGLAICKELTELLGGEIQLKSEEGKGSEFSVILPNRQEIPTSKDVTKPKQSQVFIQEQEPSNLKSVSDPEREEYPDPPSPENEEKPILVNSMKGKRVLVVDDDMRNIYSIGSVLEQYGLIMEVAQNGDEALAILLGGARFDVAIMDIMMPKMDGYETMKRIRENKQLVKLPIIVLTAKVMKEERKRCLDAGATDYLTKPFNETTLINQLQLWMFQE